MRDWDDAYANSAHVPGSDKLPALWAERAAAYRAGLASFKADIAYGSRDRQCLDLVLPDGETNGLVVFVHGGYWMRFDKSFWTDLAEGARQLGWAMALPSYTLAPTARVSEITAEIAAAVATAAAQVAGPIRLAGHSAGGHLVTRILCDDSRLEPSIYDRIAGTLSISGLHDLRPLLKTKMNDTLGLTIEEATIESAALHLPRGGSLLTTWVGAWERPEFIRQGELMANVWTGFDVPTRSVVAPGHNHFTIVDGLKDPSSAITRSLVGLDWQ
ncbi:alpha/beta hydrolase fold domain-containing protein [Bradyrhizobium tropiciagri]|uniref:alpha/beta hydrolase n=1 Tax=Bradyrhizobium tropiciagri TaxID=312253 RepID=UPI001BA89167|nr:alpha/beta hydrolase [Bradyrhizobium tropiciagri]MBR0896780.1 alpha/beta hydrolase fold domain-containing protein [Bradyrhizobium tropiciagri]